MKLWNTFVEKHRVHGNMYIQDSCIEFARCNKKLLRVKYRHQFLRHLVLLYDQSLIDRTTFLLCFSILDKK